MPRAIAWMWMASLLPACVLEVDYAESGFACSDGQCPGDYECMRQQCVPKVSANLLVHWTFDDLQGGVAADTSGNGRDGAVVGAAVFEEGRFGGAYQFDGLGGSVSDANGPDYLNGLVGLTVTLWCRSEVTNTNAGVLNGIFPAEGETADATGLSIRYDEFGADSGEANLMKLGVSAGDGDTELEFETASDTQTTDWQFLAMTWRAGSSVRFYIDGEKIPPASIDPAFTAPLGGVDTLVVGKGAKDVDTSWLGLIDDVRIYDEQLTAEELAVIGGF